MFQLLRRLREELKVNTTCGASNVCFGLPNRHGLNAAFLPMVIGAGMTSAIMNPLHRRRCRPCMGADVADGHTTRTAARWITQFREATAPSRPVRQRAGDGAPPAAARRGGRRRAAAEARPA